VKRRMRSVRSAAGGGDTESKVEGEGGATSANRVHTHATCSLMLNAPRPVSQTQRSPFGRIMYLFVVRGEKDDKRSKEEVQRQDVRFALDDKLG
jgi:hypothetical protein